MARVWSHYDVAALCIRWLAKVDIDMWTRIVFDNMNLQSSPRNELYRYNDMQKVIELTLDIIRNMFTYIYF